MAEKHRQGKKNRKFNRKKDSLAQKRYISEKRSDRNRLRRAKKYSKKFNVIVKIKYQGRIIEVK